MYFTTVTITNSSKYKKKFQLSKRYKFSEPLYPHLSNAWIFLIIQPQQSRTAAQDSFQFYFIFIWISVILISGIILYKLTERMNGTKFSLQNTILISAAVVFGSATHSRLTHNSGKVFILSLSVFAFFFNVNFTDNLFVKYTTKPDVCQLETLDELIESKMVVFVERGLNLPDGIDEMYVSNL